MSTPRVLLVDDEPNMRWTMAEFLKRGGYEVLTASDFDGAMAALEEPEIDAAVVDIILPGRSGVELLKEVNSRAVYLPVVMITGEPNPLLIPEIVRAGAYDFIAKPILKEALLTAVARAVEKKRLVDEKGRLEQEIKRHAAELEERVAARTAELAEAHSFLNLVLDSSTEYAIVAVDTEGRITLYNRGAERLFGYAAEEAIGREPGELLGQKEDEDFKQTFLAGVRGADASGRHQVEGRFRRADGGELFASVAVTPIRASGGAVIGYLGVIKDLTVERENAERLRLMQERLAHQEKIAALGRAAAQMAHEVKNPLAGMLLYAMHLRNKAADKLAGGELALIDKLVETINHLTNTVEQVMNFARPVRLAPRPLDLNQVVSDVLQLLEPQASANRIERRLELDERGCLAVLDEASVRSALMNLILNSIQAMPDGGTLRVKSLARETSALVEINDTGRGMTEEQVANIFEPFYTTKSQGMGLGMSYVAKVIEQHGGTVAVESRAGEGTTIRVELPREAEVS
ncbi:MAG TPA: ATP-binding protein [Pyrinomonadaceae bacterium]|nr:ATP-binding protein [Pyrinomonadaceae bacterium]